MSLLTSLETLAQEVYLMTIPMSFVNLSLLGTGIAWDFSGYRY